MSDKATSGFDALLEEIGGLAKALPADGEAAAADDKVAAAAAEGDEDEEKGEDAEGETMGKSFKLKLDDGSEVDAVDGTELVKALVARVEGNESKTMEAVTGLLGFVKAQGELVKSLQGQVAALANSGKGRKTVLTVSEKPAAKAEELAKSESAPGGMTGEDFLAKSMTALAAGRITSRDIALAEQAINAGQQPHPAIVKAVLA